MPYEYNTLIIPSLLFVCLSRAATAVAASLRKSQKLSNWKFGGPEDKLNSCSDTNDLIPGSKLGITTVTPLSADSWRITLYVPDPHPHLTLSYYSKCPIFISSIVKDGSTTCNLCAHTGTNHAFNRVLTLQSIGVLCIYGIFSAERNTLASGNVHISLKD